MASSSSARLTFGEPHKSPSRRMYSGLCVVKSVGIVRLSPVATVPMSVMRSAYVRVESTRQRPSLDHVGDRLVFRMAALENFQYHRSSTSSTMTTPPDCRQKNGCCGRAYRPESTTDRPLESSRVRLTVVEAYRFAICVDATRTLARVCCVMPTGTSTRNRSSSGMPICRAVFRISCVGKSVGMTVAPAVMYALTLIRSPGACRRCTRPRWCWR